MSVEEVTTESWGSRLGNSFKGIITGGVLFLAGIPLLFWNEGRAVKTAKALEEGEAVCRTVPSIDTIDMQNEGKLIHATGNAVTQDVLTDDMFSGISMKAIKLYREVEYYQWVEHESTREEKQVGGSVKKTTTYTYSKEWVSSPEDSSSYKEAGHDNIVHMPGLEDKRQTAKNVRFGAFALTEGQVNSIGGTQPVALADIEWPAELAGRTTVSGDMLYIGAPVGYMPAMQPGMMPGMMNRMTPAPGMQPGVTPPGMTQTVATQPIPAERVMQVPVIANGGSVTAPTLAPTPINVTTVDGVAFVITPDGNATPLMPNGIYYNGNLHAITATVPGNGFVYNQNAAANVTYANITNYGSLPLITVENREFVRLPEGALARVETMNGARQALINGAWLPVSVSNVAQLPAPTVGMTVQPGAAGTTMGTANPGAPQIGDVRIKWTYVPDTMPVSIVACQTNGTFSPYVAENGYTVDLLQTGTKSKEVMFQAAKDSNTMWTWILRFVGWLMMYMGISMILKPLSVLGDVLPIIGNIIEFGTGIIAFTVASVVALVVIAIAWLAYRPVLGITMLVAAIALVVLIIKKKKAAKPAEAPAEAPAETQE